MKVPQNPSQDSQDILPEIARSSVSPRLKQAIGLFVLLVVLAATTLAWQRVRGSGNRSLAAASTAQTRSVSDQQSPASEVLVPFATPSQQMEGIVRLANPRTIIPNRPREEVISYTVQLGDNLFSIATNYGLKPETILWGNFETLKDNPEILQVDQVLNILPVDGAYYKWTKGDNLNNIAAFFKVTPSDILDYTGNKMDLTTSITSTLAIKPDTWVIIPGGKRPLKDWGPPAISRSNPAVARYYGPGSCGSVYEGAIGAGVFIWPTTEHFISGYNFSPIHQAIDIGGQLGNAVYAADSGVVVYAGWSNYGYGNLLVIDHGNGWQTAYAHLSAIGVTCGQSVGRGTMVGAIGSTGNSSGPHLHFEMAYNGAKVNPLDYIQ